MSFASTSLDGGYGVYTAVAYKQTQGYNPAPAPPIFYRIEEYVGNPSHPKLLWERNKECDLDGYRICRRPGNPNGPFTLIATVGSSVTEYIDTEIVFAYAGYPYYY